ncbi:MAG: signal peptidase I [Bacillota bacterium]|nr:signal peptidase I [Bacillota bacterium]
MAKSKPSKPPKNAKQSFFGWIRYLLVMSALFGLGYAAFHFIPALAKYDHFVIGSGSMTPVIKVNDVVIINDQYPLDALKPGDIVAFYADIRDDGSEEVIIHYLNAVTVTDGIRTFSTQSAVSDSIDAWELTDEDIIGLHVMTIPRVGRLLMFVQSTIGKIVVIVDIVLIYLLLRFLFAPIKKKLPQPHPPVAL